MVSAARAMRAVPASSSPWPPAISWAPPDGILAILTPRTPGMPPSRAFPPSMPKSRAFFNSLRSVRRIASSITDTSSSSSQGFKR